MALEQEFLRRLFGATSSGSTPDERARTSRREFVRSQDHLAVATRGATGSRLSAWQAYKAFGIEKIEEAHEYGSAVIVSDNREPAATIRKSREDRGLRVDDLARAAGMNRSEIIDLEDPTKTNSIQNLRRIAVKLGLDESALSFVPVIKNDDRLGVRLRRLKDSNPAFTAQTVIAFDEAAWLARKQEALGAWIGDTINLEALGFVSDSRFGDRGYPAWQYGYELAHSTRRNLGIKSDEPIASLRDIIESRLKIPLVHLSLPWEIAGATIANGSARGIAVNIEGRNSNEWVRRATIAHELGHLLWDPDEVLQSVVVDTFEELEGQPPQLKNDHVEARANAFAIEFLAPKDAALDTYQSEGNPSVGLRKVMERFGVSFTSAKFQIWNALGRTIPLERFSVQSVEPTDEWKGRESYTVDFFPVKNVPVSRRGRFAWTVVKALSLNLVSMDSCCFYLECTESELVGKMDDILSLY